MGNGVKYGHLSGCRLLSDLRNPTHTHTQAWMRISILTNTHGYANATSGRNHYVLRYLSHSHTHTHTYYMHILKHAHAHTGHTEHQWLDPNGAEPWLIASVSNAICRRHQPLAGDGLAASAINKPAAFTARRQEIFSLKTNNNKKQGKLICFVFVELRCKTIDPDKPFIGSQRRRRRHQHGSGC